MRKSVLRDVLFVLAGLLIGASFPLTYGIHTIIQFREYAATLPPETAMCGMPLLGAYAMIFMATPFCGLVGAAVGYGFADVLNELSD
ncbi:MAG: hypothetical protein AAF664_22340 [Planctomycetota bacterium]